MNKIEKDADPQLNAGTIITLVNEFLPKGLNLSHRKCLAGMGLAMCTQRDVDYRSLSFGLPSGMDAGVRRIERTLDMGLLPAATMDACMLDRMLGPGVLTVLIDRTQWKLGFPALVDYNVLQASLATPDSAIPYMGTVLDNKGGTAGAVVTVDFLDTLLRSLGRSRIGRVSSDREFSCAMVLRYLYANHINFVFRAKRDTTFTTASDPVPRTVASLGAKLHCGQHTRPRRVTLCKTVHVWLTVAKGVDRKGKPQLVCIISNGVRRRLLGLYRQRWLIECSFRFMKSSGFRVNKTHIRKLGRFAQLWRLAMIMAVICWHVGRVRSRSRPIPVLSHGRRCVSTFKYGLMHIIRTVKCSPCFYP